MTTSALGIDFASRRYGLGQRAGLWALIGAILVAAAVTDQILDIRARHAAALEHLERSHPTQKLVIRSADPRLEAQIKEANAALTRLSIRWDDLFATVEAADSQDLGLLSLAPDPATGSIRISGEAKQFEDILAFVTRLADQPALSQVQLASYQTTQRDAGVVIDFMVTAQWR